MKYIRIIEFSDIKVSLFKVWENSSRCLVVALAFFVIGTILTLGNGVENTYYASTNLYCPVGRTYSETNNAIEIISSYASLIESQKVTERAAASLGNTTLNYKNIQSMISYSTSTSGINLTISAYSSDQDIAVRVANAVANAFVEEMRNMMGTDVVQILSAADNASLSSNGLIQLWSNRIVFLLVGLFISAAFIFFKELFSDRIRSLDQCVLTDKDVVIGAVPDIKK